MTGAKGRVILILLVLLLMAGGGLGCSQPSQAEVRIGYLLGDLHQISFAVALEKGFFKDAGIEVKEVGPFDAGPAEMNALEADQEDMGWVGMPPAILAAARKVELSIVAGVNSEGSALVVNSAINSVADLRGKKIATPQPGSIQYVLLGMLLAKNNMSSRDLEILAGTIKPPDMPGALETGRIDGYIIWEPYAAAAVVRGAGKVLVESKDIWPGHPCCVVVVRKDFAQQNPEAVAGVVAAHKRATEFIQKNPAEAKKIAVKFTKLDASTIDEAWPRVIYDTKVDAAATEQFVKEIINLGTSGAVQPIIKPEDVPDTSAFVSKLIDLSFLNK
jgi:NitT/TauT family transport system substrate-binding protein